MKSFRIGLIAVVCLILTYGLAEAQISSGGEPVSFHKRARANVPMMTMPAVDVQALLAEDEIEQEEGLPFRFGFPHEVNLTLDNSGVWETLDDGDKIWRLAIKCPGAYSINLTYDQFELPEGARFHLYTDDRQMVLGAFTSHNNKDHGKFATAPSKGSVTVLEYYLPAGQNDRGQLSIERVVHGYKNVFFGLHKDDIDPTDHYLYAKPCNINVNCPEGEPWHDQTRSVVMTIVDGATRQCSGVMVNNIREDLTPYLLTANHCLGGEDTWLVVFNYESPSCENIVGPGDMTVSGVTLIAANDYSDFGLVELSEQPPPSYDVCYSGWSASDVPSQSSVSIHHPKGDIKKISFDTDPAVSTDYFSSSGVSHWRVVDWNAGITEGGSSGGPLFDQNHRIVGQLHGGETMGCGSLPKSDWYGKFSMSWNYGVSPETRLKDWLDPDNTGALAIDGLEGECCVDTRGNVNGDPLDILDLMDLQYMTQWLWADGPAPPCMKEADADGDGHADGMDLVYLVAYLWEGGPPPVDCEF